MIYDKKDEAMDLRNLSANTQRSYPMAVSRPAKHYILSPDKITEEMVEDYLLCLRKGKGQASNSREVVACVLRFF